MAATADRLTAAEIYERVESNADDELVRSSSALAFSGLGAGIAMGLTGLGVASGLAILGEGQWARFVSSMLYPVGFIAVIVGRAQLFTENTLYPVVVAVDRRDRRTFVGMTRLWTIVFATNIVGAFVFALLAVKAGGLDPKIVDHLVKLGRDAGDHSWSHVFVSGIFGGWLVALVAWLVSAAQRTIGQIVIIWMLTFMLGVAHFSHCIASSGEILSSVLNGTTRPGAYFAWLAAATLGNVVGGVFIVALLNYGQVRPDGPDS
jgi:formate/nitrite transporter FocA (FNT family)